MLFNGPAADPKSVGKEARKDIQSGTRDLEREIQKLEREEQKLVVEAKTLAKKGDLNGAKLAARNVVQIRNAKQRLLSSKSQMRSLSLKTHEIDAQMTQVAAVKSAAKAMSTMNAATDVKSMSAVLREFEKQSNVSQLTTESLDDLFDDGEDDEADAEISKIFEELSITQTEGMQSPPKTELGWMEKEDSTQVRHKHEALK